MGGNERHFLRMLLLETCSIYRLGVSRLGLCHVGDGLVFVLVGSGLMWLNQGAVWSGIGVWTGLPIMVTGITCLLSRQKNPRGKISGVTLMSILSMACAGFIFSSAAYNIDRLVISANATDHFPHYQLPSKSPLLACNSLLLVFGMLEFVVSIWTASLSVGLVCLCCNIGRDQVFTIPYEGMETEGLPRCPDIVQQGRSAVPAGPGPVSFEYLADESGLPGYPPPAARRAAPPVLQIDMDMEWDEMAMAAAGEEELEVNVANFVNPHIMGSHRHSREAEAC